MEFSEGSRQSLIPSFLYSPSTSLSTKLTDLDRFATTRNPAVRSSALVSPSTEEKRKSFVIPAPSEPAGKIAMYSPAFYAASAAGGSLCCGLTHTALTPLDIVKCNMQVRSQFHPLPLSLCLTFFFITRVTGQFTCTSVNDRGANEPNLAL